MNTWRRISTYGMMKPIAEIATLLALAVAFSTDSVSAESVPCWQPRDFAFSSKAQTANPFLVEFAATAGWGDAPLTLHLKESSIP